MKRHLANLLHGIAAVGNVLSEPRSYTDTRNGFRKDMGNLRQDTRAVADRFNRQIRKEYGKQKYSS